VSRLIIYTKKVSYTLTPFERRLAGPAIDVLFVGDSTAVGTGASDNSLSVAGWLAADHPQAQVLNRGANGKRLAELARQLPFGEKRWDLLVVQIGGNDILRFTPLAAMERDLDKVMAASKDMADTVAILHSGNVGLSPIFLWPLSWIYEERSRQVRALYLRKARQAGIRYVDLFTERHDDLFLKDTATYYSPDLLHPSGDGYRWWYQRLKETLADGLAGQKLTR
jgi:lysophospholipase L1-like esterase